MSLTLESTRCGGAHLGGGGRRTAWAIYQIQGQAELCSEAILKKTDSELN